MPHEYKNRRWRAVALTVHRRPRPPTSPPLARLPHFAPAGKMVLSSR